MYERIHSCRYTYSLCVDTYVGVHLTYCIIWLVLCKLYISAIACGWSLSYMLASSCCCSTTYVCTFEITRNFFHFACRVSSLPCLTFVLGSTAVSDCFMHVHKYATYNVRCNLLHMFVMLVRRFPSQLKQMSFGLISILEANLCLAMWKNPQAKLMMWVYAMLQSILQEWHMYVRMFVVCIYSHICNVRT